jgi:Ion channel
MRLLLAVFGLMLMTAILWDAFETIILPRRVTRLFRLARFFYRSTWRPWRAIARHMKSPKRRDAFLSFYGPLSLLVLFGVWAFGLVFSFATLYNATRWIFGAPHRFANFRTDLYLSGTTFFTLGLGDIVPHTTAARVVAVIEAGMGFGFLAIVISYLPVLYGAFSQREVNISLLDARAGSPPSAAELLRRHLQDHKINALAEYLRDWERWSAELMESHLSYPVLCYFRSQHQNQSWLAALTAILDVCALIMAAAERDLTWQAGLTFAISRHAIVDLAQVMGVPPLPPAIDRLDSNEFVRLQPLLDRPGFEIRDIAQVQEKLRHLRGMYEPYVEGFSDRLLMPLPRWISSQQAADNWRTSAWKPAPAVTVSAMSRSRDDHF